MRIRSRQPFVPMVLALAALLAPDAASAYGGPGSIITGIGALLAVVAAVAAAVFGFIWFPVKRLLARLRGGPEDEDEAGTAEQRKVPAPE